MSTRNLAMLLAGAVVLGGCATAGSEVQPSPYAGRHDHMRDAKQGPAPSAVLPQAPSTRKSLRPAS